MSKKNKIAITRADDFAEVEDELASAIENLDDANARIESLLREQHQSEDEGATDPASTEGASEADSDTSA